ncbi:metal-sensitive transcriptional regulator [Clostridium sp. OS1-26]|uniref:metal-sensitive transcriptional regulator n=1 Tax=Clostridium sp. OS1-26 TaxID=3070681 RepID=UPI0027DFE747|nr:metal-sensitive transcriptional regulator [Clostridium sp. OS1-26]WML35268.1 metal-sensitive transcriptional regulator [Clostridium sp. OS1-26]
MEDKSIVTKKDIQTRLRRIEGQIKGIEKMVDNEACCKEILIQVAAARAAINKVGAIVLENYAKRCFGHDSENQEEIKNLEELVSTLTMFLK